MKKSVKVRIICLIVALVVLSSAVAAAAVAGSPYETIKKALLDALTYRNATVESDITISANGEPVETSRTYCIVGDNSALNHYFDEDGNIIGFDYTSNGLYINRTATIVEDSSQWYQAYVSPYDEQYIPRRGFGMFDPEERNSSMVRFYELLLDALVGDLKNNVTMTSENGIRYIQGTLTENQFPEIVKAGLDAFIERSGNSRYETRKVSFDGNDYVYEDVHLYRDTKTVMKLKQPVRPMTADEKEAWYDGTFYDHYRDITWGVIDIDGVEYINTAEVEQGSQYTVPATRADYGVIGNPLDLPMKNLVFNYVHGEAEIDSSGNLLCLDVSGMATVTSIFGEVFEVEIEYHLRFTDIGSSLPVSPVPGAERLLTADYMKTHFGSSNVNVYFLLNEDGSINSESITTTYPEELHAIEYAYAYDDGSVAKMVPPALPPTVVVTTETPTVVIDEGNEEAGIED